MNIPGDLTSALLVHVSTSAAQSPVPLGAKNLPPVIAYTLGAYPQAALGVTLYR